MPTKVATPQGSWFDVPIIGSHIAKIGRIIDLWSDPCAPTPEIWAKALWGATPTALLTAAKPELVDIDIPSRRPRPRKGLRGAAAAALKLTDNIVSVPVPRWRAFQAFELSELAGFYLFLASIAEDAIINWMSLAYEYQGCEIPGIAHFYAHSTQDLFGSTNLHQFLFSSWEALSHDNFSFNSQQIIPLKGTEFRTSVNINAAPHPTQSPQGQFLGAEVVDLNTGTIIANDEATADGEGGNAARLSGRFRLGEGERPQLAVRIFQSPGWMLLTKKPTWSTTTSIGKNLGVDP